MKRLFIRYKYPSCILIVTIVLGCLAIFFVKDLEIRTTATIAVLGFGLGLFQFLVSETNTNIRWKLDLKLQRRAELKKLIESVCESINVETYNKNIDFHGLLTHLRDSYVAICRAVDEDEYIFPRLKNTDSYNKLMKAIIEIDQITDSYKRELKSSPKSEEIQRKHRIDWHNDTTIALGNFHNYRAAFFKEIDREISHW